MSSPAMGLLFDEEYPDTRLVMIDGECWRVREARRLVPRLATVLVFDHPDLMRITQHFPSTWRALSDTDLCALSLRR